MLPAGAHRLPIALDKPAVENPHIKLTGRNDPGDVGGIAPNKMGEPSAPRHVAEKLVIIPVEKRHVPFERNAKAVTLLFCGWSKAVVDLNLQLTPRGQLTQPWGVMLGWVRKENPDPGWCGSFSTAFRRHLHFRGHFIARSVSRTAGPRPHVSRCRGPQQEVCRGYYKCA